jgi:hypothetical protein
MITSIPRSWLHRSVALATGSVLIGGLLASSVAAQAPAEECPEAMPVADIQKGQVATGFTVREGRTVESFSAEVLGVLPDGILPGRDLIIVDTSGPLIDDAGGIWYGMSGSPVYYQGKLMGALAYGLAWGPSSIAGLTPAEDMMDVLGYQDEEDDDGGSIYYSPTAKARLTARLTQAIARSTDTPSSGISSSMDRLRVPLSISGLGPRGMDVVRSAVEREGLGLLPYSGSAASAEDAAAPGTTILPGETFAGTLSYGDITSAGVGTATFTCNGMTMAFGHPFFFAGDVQMGANAGDTLTIVSDSIYGSYKLANIAEAVGAVTQDRLAGIRATLGGSLPTTPITSSVTSLDLSKSQEGRTDIVMQEIVPFYTFIHMFTNIDSVFDQISQGSSVVTWTIQGTRESGSPWVLSRENKFVSDYDISFGSLFEIEEILYALMFNDFEDVEVTSVDVDVTLEEAITTYEVHDVLVLKKGVYEDVRRVTVDPGDTISYRIVLRPYQGPEDGSQDILMDQEVTVPRTTKQGGMLRVARAGTNGGFDFYCFIYGYDCSDNEDEVSSFDELLTELSAKPKNYELAAELQLGRRERVKDENMSVLDHVVRGHKRIKVILRGFEGSGKRGGHDTEVVFDKCC